MAISYPKKVCMTSRVSMWLVLVMVALLMSSGLVLTAHAEFIVIDSVLGLRAKYVPGIETMSQGDVAREAALFAMEPNGWDLLSFGAYLEEYGPPGWIGGVEWSATGVPAEYSDLWGYALNQQAQNNGNRRHLMFHTDDTVYRGSHDVCEPSPFGIISGWMDGVLAQCGITEWGTYYVADNSPVSAELSEWSAVKALYR